MHIRFARPITKLIGVQDCTITVRQSVTLREVVDILAQKFAHTQIFQVNSKNEFVPYVCMVFKNGRHLVKMGDKIENCDELEFIPPLEGG